MTAPVDDYVQALLDATPHKAGDLVADKFPEEPGVYMSQPCGGRRITLFQVGRISCRSGDMVRQLEPLGK